MQTSPMPLDGLSADSSGLNDFRLSEPKEIAALLRRLADGNINICLHGGSDRVVDAVLWAADAERGTIGLSVLGDDPGLDALIDAREAVAVTYLDSVKLQFDLSYCVLVRSDTATILSCAYPRDLFRFQRRNAYRVRPLLRSAPCARVRHTEIAEMRLALRVLDVSIGGCALFMPDDLPPLRPGVVLNQVLLELDADTRFHADLRLQHITSMAPETRGVRLGCEFVATGGDALRALQRFIDQTQKRGKLLSLG